MAKTTKCFGLEGMLSFRPLSTYHHSLSSRYLAEVITPSSPVRTRLHASPMIIFFFKKHLPTTKVQAQSKIVLVCCPPALELPSLQSQNLHQHWGFQEEAKDPYLHSLLFLLRILIKLCDFFSFNGDSFIYISYNFSKFSDAGVLGVKFRCLDGEL